MASAVQYRVTFRTPEGETSIAVAEDQYLLLAAWDAGIDLPATCLQGWCTTCAALIEDGQVDQSEAFRLFETDINAGFVLLCSAFPRSDLVITTHQKEALRAQRRANSLPAPRG